MTEHKGSFINLMDTIIKDEFSSTQWEMYQIEGVELIDKLFQGESVIESADIAAGEKNYAFSAEIQEIVKYGPDFLSLIVSSFTLFLNYSKFISENKKSESESRLKKLELLKKLKDDMVSQNMSQELIHKIDNKYIIEMMKLMDEL